MKLNPAADCFIYYLIVFRINAEDYKIHLVFLNYKTIDSFIQAAEMNSYLIKKRTCEGILKKRYLTLSTEVIHIKGRISSENPLYLFVKHGFGE